MPFKLKTNNLWVVFRTHQYDGSSQKDYLGVYSGNPFDIAGSIAAVERLDTLLFVKANDPFSVGTPVPKALEVEVQLDGVEVSDISEMLSQSKYGFTDKEQKLSKYQSTRVVIREPYRKELIKKQALSKLTVEERAILGI